VPELLGAVAAAAGVFAGTNVDDLIVLTVLFLAARASGRPKVWQVWAGQYGGIAALVLVAGLGALGLTLVPDRWVGLLGLVPLGPAPAPAPLRPRSGCAQRSAAKRCGSASGRFDAGRRGGQARPR